MQRNKDQNSISNLTIFNMVILKQVKGKAFLKLHRQTFTKANLSQKQPLQVFYKKAVLKSFTISTGKYLCWSPFLINL